MNGASFDSRLLPEYTKKLLVAAKKSKGCIALFTCTLGLPCAFIIFNRNGTVCDFARSVGRSHCKSVEFCEKSSIYAGEFLINATEEEIRLITEETQVLEL